MLVKLLLFRLMSHHPVKLAQDFMLLAKIAYKDFRPAGENIFAVTWISISMLFVCGVKSKKEVFFVVVSFIRGSL